MDQSRLDELLNLYLDGMLSSDEKTELQDTLRDDANARHQFWVHARFHGSLRLLSEQASGVSDVVSQFSAQSESGLTSPEAVPRASLFEGSLWKSLALLVACAMLLVGGFWFADPFPKDNAEIDQSVDPGVESFLAIIIEQSADAKWGGTDGPAGVGYAIGHERTVLERGESTLRLDNEVELKLRGPAELTLLSVDHGVLHRGQVSARVPEAAIGFRLDGPDINVVDLGTEFSLSVDESGTPRVHVFKGKVRAALPSVPSSRTELLTGESASFDVARGLVTHNESDLRQFPRLTTDIGLPTTSGNIAYLRQVPRSVRVGTYEHNSILVFQEQEDFVLPQDMRVLRGATNQFGASEPSVPEYVKLSAGTHLQSYFVHMDQIGDQAGFAARGRIRFEQPILGVVVAPAMLQRTDEWLRRGSVTYDDGHHRHLEMRYLKRNPPDSYDEVDLSEDGHELTMTLRIGPKADQFRVLVAVKTDE